MIDSSELYHHGVKNQKWGYRQYQNHDGSLTPLGRIHYGVGEARKGLGKVSKSVADITKKGASKAINSIRKKKATNEELFDEYDKKTQEQARRKLEAEIKRLDDIEKGKKPQPRNLDEMNDDEILRYMNRLRNEKEIRKLEKEARQGPVGRLFETYAKEGIKRAVASTVEKKISNFFKDEEKVKYSDVLRETEAKLKLDVLGGDQDAAKRLSDLRDVTGKKGGTDNKPKGESKPKGNNKNNSTESNNSNTNKPKASEFKNVESKESHKPKHLNDTNEYEPNSNNTSDEKTRYRR